MKNLKLKKNQKGFFSGLGAALAGGALSFLGQKSANKESAASTARQMEFQERMSNTAHVREIKDLRNAGLNPILSAKYGGASTPGGAQYQAQNTMAGANQAVQNYWSGKQTEENVKLTKQQTRKTGYEADIAGNLVNPSQNVSDVAEKLGDVITYVGERVTPANIKEVVEQLPKDIKSTFKKATNNLFGVKLYRKVKSLIKWLGSIDYGENKYGARQPKSGNQLHRPDYIPHKFRTKSNWR